MQQPQDNGIYYFIGNITSHILHALPLHKKLGGTFIVTSTKARKEIERLYNVPVINIDNRPFKIMKPGRRPKLIHEYIIFDKRLKKTYDFLNTHATIVLFYELFELEKPEWLARPKKIFLTHGNMLKSYMTMYPKRLEIIKDYDYMAALGPHMKQQFIQDGVDASQLIDIGIARTDDVVHHQQTVLVSPQLQQLITAPSSTPIISYVPTFWGASSIYTTGLELMRYFPDDHVLLFRPHPQTPRHLLAKYQSLIKAKPNIIYLPEGQHPDITLVDLFNASSAIIGDVSSVVLEALLTRKPLIFAYDKGDHKQQHEYQAISDVVRYSQSINATNVADTAHIINTALKQGINEALWDTTIAYNFFDYKGDATDHIARVISKLAIK